jgi:DNA (cytosine-5)-methyltransferase 1
MLTAIDLFCGAGGMSLGLKRAGFDIVAALDTWEPAVKTYQQNFERPVIMKDIHTISGEHFRNLLKNLSGSVDLLAGAPPFQGFSSRNTKSKKQDNTGLLFEFARCVRSLLPRMFLLEMGPGLIVKKDGGPSDLFVRKIHELGYTVEWREVNAAEYGVPQIRKRIFCYGWLEGKVPDFSFPTPDLTPDKFRTVGNALGDLPSPPDDYSPYPGDALHRRIKLSEINLERLRHVPPGGSFKHVPDKLRPDRYNQYGTHSVMHRDVYGRLDPDKPAGVILAGFDSFTRGKFAHPFENRNITLREGARLQTFPDDFIFLGNQREIVTMIGTATPPLLAEKIGHAIVRHLLGKKTTRRRSSRSSPTTKRKQTVWDLSFKGTFNLFPEQSPTLRQFLEADGKTDKEVIKLLSAMNGKGGRRDHTVRKSTLYKDFAQMYRTVGLLYEREDAQGFKRLKVTPLGNFVRKWLDTLNKANRDLFAHYLASALAVCQLHNPVDGHGYDDSMKVFPFAFIWRAMLALDGKLSSKEITGALFKIRNETDLNEAINNISEARRKNDLSILGKPIKCDEKTIGTWMAMASFGGTLMVDRKDLDSGEYWEIHEKVIDVLETVTSVNYRHRDFEASDKDAVEKYMEHVSRAAILPKDLR